VIPGLLLSLFFNPSVLRTPPLYFAVQNTEEEGILDSVAVAVFNPSVFLTPSPYGHSPYMAVPHRGRGLKSSLSPYVVL